LAGSQQGGGGEGSDSVAALSLGAAAVTRVVRLRPARQLQHFLRHPADWDRDLAMVADAPQRRLVRVGVLAINGLCDLPQHAVIGPRRRLTG
jgi:hypothetical protein